jgi:hypothetical protein
MDVESKTEDTATLLVPSHQVEEMAIEGDYTAKLEHAVVVEERYANRMYLEDVPSSPPAWRIFHDCDRTKFHMPAEWPAERVRETFLWYLRGEQEGEEYGIKMGKRQIKESIEALRKLGIGCKIADQD